MLIDKVKPFETEQDRKFIAESQYRQGELLTQAAKLGTLKKPNRTKEKALLQEYEAISGAIAARRAEIERRYIQSLGNREAALADLKEILDATEKAEYEEEQASVNKNLESAYKIAELDANGRATLDKLTAYSRKNAATFLARRCQHQLNAIIFYTTPETREDTEELKLIYDKAAEWYEWQESDGQESDIYTRQALVEIQVDSIGGRRIDALQVPLPKLYTDIFSLLALETADRRTIPGQIAFSNVALAVESQRDRKDRTIFYSLTFDAESLGPNVKISKALNSYDEAVYNAISSLYDAGNHVMTYSQIHYAMPNDSRPSPEQIENIRNSVRKMESGWLTLNQAEDYEKYKKQFAAIVGDSPEDLGDELESGTDPDVITNYSGRLLEYRIGERTINGRLVKGALEFSREPILFSFAKSRNQITTVPREVLLIKHKQTDDFLALKYLLVRRIAHMKNDASPSSRRILYSYIYDRLGIGKNERMKRSRTVKDTYTILDHFKKTGYIAGYKETKNAKGEASVTIALLDPEKKKAAPGSKKN